MRANRLLGRKGLALLALAGLLALGAAADALAAAEVPGANPVRDVRVGQVRLRAEVAATGAAIYRGLSGRETLPPGTGMLFVMPQREVQHFCMRGMRLGLDFIWIDEGRVIGITPEITPTDRRTLSSPGPATHVLEVPAGFSARRGIKPGDRVEWEP